MSDYTIGIKLGDGSFFPVLESDFAGKKKLVLTTVRDNQENMQIDLYKSKEDNLELADYLGSLLIENIAPALKKEPEIEVILGLDQNKKLTAEAQNLACSDKKTLSVELESLDEDETNDIPDFQLDQDIMDADMDTELSEEQTIEEEKIAGEAYPFESKDRRKKHLEKKKKNPFMVILFVLAGLIVIAGLSVLIYWLINKFLPVEKEPIVTEQTHKNLQTIGEAEKKEEKTETYIGNLPVKEEQQDAEKTEEIKKVVVQDTKSREISQITQKKTIYMKPGVHYTVKKGDTLWGLAHTYYKNPFEWHRIYKHRPNKIKNPDLIFYGQRIYIPEK